MFSKTNEVYITQNFLIIFCILRAIYKFFLSVADSNSENRHDSVSQSSISIHDPMDSVLHPKSKEEPLDPAEQERHNAATAIQRAWRNHNLKKIALTSEARWKDTLNNAKMKVWKIISSVINWIV